MDEREDEPMGADLVAYLRCGHKFKRECPGCDEPVMRTAITQLAYVFDTCTCDVADYEHLVERVWHLACLHPTATKLATVEMLGTAADVLERYKRGQDTAARIRAFLTTQAEATTDAG